MKREIKYQAFDTDKNEFVDCSNHTLSQLSNNYAGLGNRFMYRQYTGLKDKNGKEIFEGDIVVHIMDERSRKTIKVVEWLDAGFLFKYIKKEGGERPFQNSNGLCPHIIIGNIYENPELLQ